MADQAQHEEAEPVVDLFALDVRVETLVEEVRMLHERLAALERRLEEDDGK